MTAIKYHVALWRDYQGTFTGVALDEFTAIATDRTSSGVLQQLKSYLVWLHRDEPWRGSEDMTKQPALRYQRVNVRPEYHHEGRTYPLDRPLEMQLPVVLGLVADGSRVCVLPTLEVRFYFQEEDAVDQLVADFALRELQESTPRQLSRFLPPEHVELTSIMVQARDRKRLEAEELPPTIKEVCEPLGERALRRRFSRAWQRDQEIAALVERLIGGRANLLLVGDGGVGKSTLLFDAVRKAERKLHEDRAQQNGSGTTRHKFWQTSGARIIAGMQYLGQWEERCEAIIEELADIEGVLCVENLLDLISVGGGESSPMASFLQPYLERQDLRMIAEVTHSELDACRRLIPAFVDLFDIVPVEAMDQQQATAVLEQIATEGQNGKIALGEGVVPLVYRLFRRFLPYYPFPGRSAAFFRETFERADRDKLTKIEQTNVVSRFARETGLPESLLRDDVPLAMSDVLGHFQQQVIGQPHACRVAAQVVTTLKAGLNDPNRPLGVLLFCGPTGVGKTQLAKTLADYLFGTRETKDGLIRLDMSEYSGFGAAERLLSQSGVTPSELIQKVRRQPFVVVLLDEIEKASSDVFDVLLSMFDEGRLTDRHGRTTTFRSAVIIMTSNLGVSTQQPLGFDSSRGPSYETEIAQFFRAEFVNRIDAVVSFNALSQQDILAITRKELNELVEREGFAKRNLRLEWSLALVEHLAESGYDARLGARPLQRNIERAVVVPLARWLLAHPEAVDRTLQLELSAEKTIAIS